ERPHGLRGSIRDSVDGYRTLARDRLLQTFAVGVFFWYFLMQFANFLYLLGLNQAAAGNGVASEDFFSQLYASVYTSSSIVALFIQSVITSAALRRLGIARVLFVLPLWYLATYAGAAISAPDALGGGHRTVGGVPLQHVPHPRGVRAPHRREHHLDRAGCSAERRRDPRDRARRGAGRAAPLA